MTEKRTGSFKKGNRCRICTGCGRCFGNRRPDVVSGFAAEGLFTQYAPLDGKDREEAAGDCVAAVDIGTTTIAMQLRSMADGEVFDTFTCLNPQRNYGADVLSRIEAAEEPEAAEAMQKAVRDSLEQGIRRFRRRLSVLQLSAADKKLPAGKTESGADIKPILKRMVIAANTTMVHLLMGYDVSKLGSYPFEPQTLSAVHTKLFDLDTVILPGASAFVGGDIVAGIHALRMQEREEVTLLLDLGTNGEMVLGNKDRLIAAATAAGPAFEGNGECHGADLMALTAALLKEGLLDSTGLLAEPYFENGVDVGGVHLTQQYIRQLQMAKSAICTGIRILCRKYGLTDTSAISRVWLAGGMGYYLDSASAADIGLFPAELAERTKAVGNAALEGAFLYGREAQNAVEIKAPAIEVFNLAEEPDFSETYIDGMELCSCK